MDYSIMYKKVSSSVVKIELCDEDNILSSSTGAVIADGKNVLTCSHCCDFSLDNGISINENFVKGKIVFNDPKEDIAILEFPEVIGTPLKFADSDSVEIGNEIFTIGFPLGGEKTLTVGNVAAFEGGFIKINSSVNNGNSGGPLFNLKGEIIGVVNSKLGSLSEFLKSILGKDTGNVFVAGVNVVGTFQKLISEMEKNLNLGIGYAIPTKRIARISPLVRDIMNTK